MKIQTKIALMLLAGAISLPVALAQGTDQGPGPAPAKPSGSAMHRSMHGGGGGWGGRDGRGDRGPGRGQWGRRHRMGMGMRGRRGGRDFMLVRIIGNPSMRQRLGITTEQATKIREETSAFQITQIRSRADSEVKRIELRNLLSADQPDRDAINKKLEEISAVRLAQEKAAVDFRLSVRDVLTPDQRQKLQQMRQGPGQRGPRRGGPGGPNAQPASPTPPGGN